MSAVDRTTEPDDQFRVRVARFDAAPDAEESLRERVAVALYEATEAAEYVEWPDATASIQITARVMADAAIAVMRGDDV